MWLWYETYDDKRFVKYYFFNILFYYISGNFTFLSAKFIFTRRLTGAIFNVYIPSTLVVLLSWISFWVDVEAVPARVTLGVTSLLTLTTQVVQVHSGLPPISYLTAMDIWLFACLIGVFSVLVEFAFAYQFCLFSEKVSEERGFMSLLNFLKYVCELAHVSLSSRA